MKKFLISCVVTATAFFTSGCRPDESVWWSPDGQTAAIRTAEGIRLASDTGQLSPVVLEGEVQRAAWLRDGSALIVSRMFKVADWNAAESLIPPAEAAAARELSRAVPDLLKAALTASGGSLDDIEKKFLEPLGFKGTEQLQSAFNSALAISRDEILAAVADLPNAKVLQAMLLEESSEIPIYEISVAQVANGTLANDVRPLVRSLHPLLDPVVSPRHAIVAFRTGGGALKATTLDGANSLAVADGGVQAAEWTTDGRSLIHVVMEDSQKIGEIRTRTVANADGALLKDADAPGDRPSAPPPDTLALAMFDPGGGIPRFRSLPDGRVLFASVPLNLPSGVASISTSARFFLLDPSNSEAPLTPVPFIENSLPGDLTAFAPSPDGKWVAVVEAGTDAVAVLELATGKVQIISPPHAGWKSRLVPAWRTDRELTFAALPSATATRPELLAWQPGGELRVLSSAWPDDVVKPWLEAPGSI